MLPRGRSGPQPDAACAWVVDDHDVAVATNHLNSVTDLLTLGLTSWLPPLDPAGSLCFGSLVAVQTIRNSRKVVGAQLRRHPDLGQ